MQKTNFLTIWCKRHFLEGIFLLFSFIFILIWWNFQNPFQNQRHRWIGCEKKLILMACNNSQYWELNRFLKSKKSDRFSGVFGKTSFDWNCLSIKIPSAKSLGGWTLFSIALQKIFSVQLISVEKYFSVYLLSSEVIFIEKSQQVHPASWKLPLKGWFEDKLKSKCLATSTFQIFFSISKMSPEVNSLEKEGSQCSIEEVESGECLNSCFR